MRLRKTCLRALTLVALLVTPPLATGPMPTEWPLERIIENLEERLRIEPDDALAHYNLGRAHAFAFALETSSLWVSDDRPHLANPATSRGPKSRT